MCDVDFLIWFLPHTTASRHSKPRRTGSGVIVMCLGLVFEDDVEWPYCSWRLERCMINWEVPSTVLTAEKSSALAVLRIGYGTELDFEVIHLR